MLQYFHTYVGSGHFGGFKILNFNIFGGGGGFRKINIFGCMKILWILFGCHHKNGLYLGVISMHLRVFLKVKVQNGGFSGGCSNFIFFFDGWVGVLEIPDILGDER